MNSNYKVVEVYLSYGENSISKIDIIKSEFGIDDVIKGVFRELDIKEFKDDDDLYYGIYSIDEKKDIGVIGYGDESIILVLGEKNDWYNKVDELNVSSDIEKEVDFSNGLYDEEDWDSHFQRLSTETKNAINKIKEISKVELKIEI